jgi:hypothetical protein
MADIRSRTRATNFIFARGYSFASWLKQAQSMRHELFEVRNVVRQEFRASLDSRRRNEAIRGRSPPAASLIEKAGSQLGHLARQRDNPILQNPRRPRLIFWQERLPRIFMPGNHARLHLIAASDCLRHSREQGQSWIR